MSTQCVRGFSTGGKFRPVSNFTKLHALTLAARSYALLCGVNAIKWALLTFFFKASCFCDNLHEVVPYFQVLCVLCCILYDKL